MENKNTNNPNQGNGGQRPPMGGPRPRRGALSWIFSFWSVLLVGLFALQIFSSSEKPVKTNWKALEEMIVAGDVDKIEVVNDRAAHIWLRRDVVEAYRTKPGYNGIPIDNYQFTYNIGNPDIFRTDLAQIGEKYGVEVPVPAYEYPSSVWRDLLGILPYLIFLVFILMMFRSASRGAAGQNGVMNVGKSKAQIYDKDNKDRITFKDVAGLEEAKVEIMEIVDFLRKPEKYRDLGGKIPKGALLVGPPGTGKTLLAKAVAGEANVPFFSISGSDFVEMFVGVGASRVRDLFSQAKAKAPCIVFIDEIDAIGRARGKNAGFSGNDERENTLNQLLTEMDGFGSNSGVIVLAATNRVDILDKALMRAGRFDRQIDVGLPELKEREAIFGVHMRRLKLADDVNVEFLAKQTPGFSGADIANVCNEAALIAARHDKKAIGKEDFLAAVDRIIGGLEKKSKVITKQEKRTIAYHEAGHATVSWLLEHANPLVKVTIIPRGRALGAAWYLPEERQITTTEQMMHEMASLLAGRASELLNFGEISTGALNDLERATKMSYAMVSYYGMSDKVGNRSFYDSTGQSDFAFSKPYGEETSILIDTEAKALIDKAFEMATAILTEYRDGLTELAELLLEKEVVFAEDLERIFGKRKKDLEREAEEQARAAKESAETERQEPATDAEDVAEIASEHQEESVEPHYTITDK
ncbi:MAG: ATP-dependent zinc metalloprotease FtsH [Tidjanibacter sp.]|nr:ATP-dependent zinc metalloprotease FtsH [Tidjanibacter sp.]